jgi:hypothetical protein
MSPQERALRSAMNRLLSQAGLLHGTLLVRQRVCGKPGCRCTRGHRHESLYLVVTEGGQGRQLYVPRQYEALVRAWLENYQAARARLDELSRLHWEKLRQRQA